MRPSLWFIAACLSVAACGEVTQEEGYDWRSDARLRVALASQRSPGHFDADTSDMLPVMVEKLAKGGRDVQNHYRGELAKAGPRSVRLLDDFIHRYSGSRTGALMIGNALGVLGLSDQPTAVGVVRKVLGHPTESVRSAAIRAMLKQAEPADYEDLRSMLPTVGGELRRVLVQAMGTADAERLAGDLSAWLRESGEPALSVLAARAVAAAGAGGSLSGELLELESSRDPNIRPFLSASIAAHGDLSARAELVSELADEDLLVRTRALEASAMSGLEGLLIEVVNGDPSESLRVLAAEAVSRLLPDSSARSALRQGCRDDEALVRQACLRGLLLAGDPEGVEIFVNSLRSELGDLGPNFRAVRGAWALNEGLADRAATALVSELEAMKLRPMEEREPWLQALGQVPSTLGAAWLIKLAEGSGGELHNMPARQWIAMQLSNGGPIGRAALSQAFEEEELLRDRMDYLWAASLSAEQDTREFLMQVVIDDASYDHERLFAAERLVKLGPTSVVAPLLKRACLRIEDEQVRPAFQALLWTWYG